MAQHIVEGTAPPAVAPEYIGQHYVDTVAPAHYLGVGTASAADWILVPDGSAIGTIATQDANAVAITGGSITGITDLAIADGGTGASSATVAFDNLSPTTTAGDLIYNNGTDNVRLGIGTAGQVLTVNAGATAPEWAASAAGGNAFGKIVVSGQSDVDADSSSDTLTLAAGSNITLTTNAGTDTVTIAASGSNAFGTVSVSGQSDVVADAAADTLTLAAGTGITITTNAGSDTVTIAGHAATAGKHAMWIAAGSITPSATGGCAALATIASAANQPDIQTLDFDATTQEYAQFSVRMPKSWNEGTVTFVPVWSHAATVTNFGVVWDLQLVAVSDDDAIAVAFGTAQTSTDTGGTTNDVYVGPESSAITVSGSPAAEDVVFGRISRVTGNGSDTMAIDARLHGITLYITTDAENDA